VLLRLDTKHPVHPGGRYTYCVMGNAGKLSSLVEVARYFEWCG